MGAAAAAKSLQPCPTLCNPIDGCPPGSPVPGILQARIMLIKEKNLHLGFYKRLTCHSSILQTCKDIDLILGVKQT